MSTTFSIRRIGALAPDLKTIGYRLAAVLAICLVLTAVSDVFLTTNNLLNVLRQTSLLFLLASGLTLVILTAGLDLSVGANIEIGRAHV
jgi:ribose transport system permease protein